MAIGLVCEQYAAFGVRGLLAVEIERIDPRGIRHRNRGNASIGEMTPQNPVQSETSKPRRVRHHIANVPEPKLHVISKTTHCLILDHGEFSRALRDQDLFCQLCRREHGMTMRGVDDTLKRTSPEPAHSTSLTT